MRRQHKGPSHRAAPCAFSQSGGIRQKVAMGVYKIFTETEWFAFETSGRFEGSQADCRDGFIHLSTEQQVRETARKHFDQHERLWLAAVDPSIMGSHLKWEPSRGGDLFPHFYGTLERRMIVETWSVQRHAAGYWLWPECIAT